MILSPLIIYLPTKCVSWFNTWRRHCGGTVVLLITTIPLPIKAFPTCNSAKDIFTLVCNRTGWALWVSLYSPIWTLSGYRVAAHLAEETHDVARDVPKAMIWGSRSSVVLGFIYLISLAYCMMGIDSLMGNAPGQPIGAIVGQVLGFTKGVVLLAINVIYQMACVVAFVGHLQRHVIKHRTLTPIFAYSLSPPRASSPTAARRPSQGTPGLAASPSAHTRQTTPLSPYSSS